jgi:hypothetical protein
MRQYFSKERHTAVVAVGRGETSALSFWGMAGARARAWISGTLLPSSRSRRVVSVAANGEVESYPRGKG